MRKDVSRIIICTLLSLYFALANTWDYTANLNGVNFYRKFFVYFFLQEVITLILFRKIENIRLYDKPKKFKKRELFVYLLIMLIPIIYMVISFYPALGETDTYSIVANSDAGILNNWHPVIYQIFFIWIPRLF